MSANQDALRRMIAAFNAADSDALRASLHPEITVRRPLPDLGIATHRSDVGSYHGIEEVIPALSELIESTGGIEVQVRRVEDAGEDAALFEFLAHMGPEENRTTWLGWSMFGFRDGLVVSTETFGTEAEARAAAARGV